jgi:osmotically-inducible protein OsmY
MGQVSHRDVRPRAQSALSKSPIFELRELRVEQRNGVLVLSGIVSSFYHKQLAQEVVRNVCRQYQQAETELINSIEVEYSS